VIRWTESTIRTSMLKCDGCKEEIGIGKIAIVFENGKSKRLCLQCGNNHKEGK